MTSWVPNKFVCEHQNCEIYQYLSLKLNVNAQKRILRIVILNSPLQVTVTIKGFQVSN